MRNDRHRLAACAALLAVLAAGIGTRVSAADLGVADAPGAAPSGCASEAEIVVRRAEVRAAPDSGAPIIATLEPGTSVYRCAPHEAFLGVMFPEPGGRTDCSMRDPGRECPVGWTDPDLDTQLTD